MVNLAQNTDVDIVDIKASDLKRALENVPLTLLASKTIGECLKDGTVRIEAGSVPKEVLKDRLEESDMAWLQNQNNNKVEGQTKSFFKRLGEKIH